MNTPTPTPITDKAKIAFTSLFVNDDGYCIPYVVGVKLERELTTVTKQRDRLAEALREIEVIRWLCDGKVIATEALQSLNQDHFPDVGNMIGTTTTEP